MDVKMSSVSSEKTWSPAPPLSDLETSDTRIISAVHSPDEPFSLDTINASSIAKWLAV